MSASDSQNNLESSMTRPVPWLFRFWPFTIFQTLPPFATLSSKSLFWNILPINQTGSIFCWESLAVAICFQYFTLDSGEGYQPVSVASREWRGSIVPVTHLDGIIYDKSNGSNYLAAFLG